MPRGAATSCLQTGLLISGSALMAGCGPSAKEKSQQDFRESFARHDVDGQTEEISHPKRVLVAQGQSPVVFSVNGPAKAHVVDLTTGAEIVALDVDRDEFVSVNETTGVLVGSRRVAPGPLLAGHQFGILVDVAGDESFKSKVIIEPVPPPRMKTIVVVPVAPAPPTSKPAPFAPTTAPAPVDAPPPIDEDDSRRKP
jgi:hypothetical protein